MNDKLTDFKELSQKWEHLKKKINGGHSSAEADHQVKETVPSRLEFEKMIIKLSTSFTGIPANEVDRGINHALQTIGESSNVDRSYVFLFSRDGKKMDNTHEWCAQGIEPQIHRRQGILVDEAFPGLARTIKQLEVFYVPRVVDLPEEATAEKDEFQLEGVQSLICVPMVYGNSLIGFLGFDSLRTQKTWSEGVIALLKIVAEIITNVLNHKHVEETLRHSQQLLKSTFASLRDAIFIVDARTVQIIECNPAASQIFGYSREDFIGQTTAFLHVDEPSLEKFRIHLYEAVQKEGFLSHLEFRMRRKDGAVFPTEHTVVPLKDEQGDLIAWVSTVCDITARKQTEEALRESEQRYRDLVETVPDVIYSLSENGTITSLNLPFESITGWSRSEWIGKSFVGLLHPDDIPLTIEAFQKVIRGQTLPSSEFRFLSKSGDYLVGELTGSPQIKNGKVAGVSGIIRDVTGRKQIEEELRESEKKFRVLTETAASGIFIHQGGKFLYVNSAAETMSGYRREELLTMNFWDMVHPDFREPVKERSQARLKGESVPSRYELKIITESGEERWVDLTVGVIEYEGKPAILGTNFDITERKRAEEALRESKERYRTLVEESFDGIFVQKSSKIVFANRRLYELLGYDEGELEGLEHWLVFHPSSQNLTRERAQARMRGETVPSQYEVKLQRKDGSSFDGEVNARKIILDNEPGIQVWVRDITERKRAEEALRESEERYRTILENIEDGYYETDLRGDLTFFNDSLCRMLGYSKDELKGMSNRQYTDEENRKKLFQVFNEVYRTGKPTEGFDWEVIRKDGTKLFGEVSVSLIKDSEGKPTGFRGIARDITERKQAEQALRAEKQRFQTLLGNAPFGMVMIDNKGDFKYINTKFIELFGYGLNDVPNGKEWFRKAYPDPTYRHHAISTWMNDSKSLEPGEKVPRVSTVTCQDGTEKIIRFITVKLETGENLMSTEDITERKLVEEERALLQEQLRQSQRMESIGLLAGGIAHDFNNLLTVIKGYGQLSLVKLEGDSPLKRNIEEIQKAADRAANLTRQLLAFGRRQMMEMKVLHLNTLLMELKEMLRRVIGEDIEMITQLAEDLGRVKTDPGQFEQVILNLAVNARDAMPTGGKLILETANVELDEAYARSHIGVKPGPYVMLVISDTGMGMTPEVRSRVFEPFFTTKEKGRGTGLGLSTVYGIVKQSQGNIWVYSEPGQGTTFKIYLPRIEEEASLVHKRGEDGFPKPGNETVLLVEDEASLRNLAGQILREQGYNVIEASNGEEALRLTEEVNDKTIHLLLTDVVMPQMSGKELAERIKPLRPHIKVLFTSGYTGDTIAHHGILEPDIAFLQKPFSPVALTRKVREVLDK